MTAADRTETPGADAVAQWWLMLQRMMAGMSDTARQQDQMQGFVAFGKLLNDLFAQLPKSADPEAFTGFWQSWAERAAVSLGPGLNFNMPGQAAFAAILKDWPQNLDGLSAANPVGMTREWQMKVHAVQKALLASTRVQTELQGVYHRILIAAWNELGSYLAARGKATPSLHEIYEHWIAAAERAYRERVMQADYSRLFGEAINTFVSLQAAIQELTDDVLRALQLPSRRELNVLYERMHAAEQSIKDLTPAAGTADIRIRQARARKPATPAKKTPAESSEKSPAPKVKKARKQSATAAQGSARRASKTRAASRKPHTKQRTPERPVSPPAGGEFDISGI